MKWLSGTLTFFNAATCIALLAGILAHGLSRPLATVSIVAALILAFFAYRTTTDVPLRRPKPTPPPDAPPPPKSKRAQRRAAREGKAFAAVEVPRWSYRSIWFWLLAACFAMFALRSFCWLIYWDGNEVKVQSPNNLGDLSLHLTYINHFASGVPLWPDNPIEPYSKLRYPAGVDLFNSLLTLLGLDVIRGLVWVGVIASIATFYAFYRWGGNFGVAAFLFNGGLVSFPVLQTYKFLDYQGANNIAWKSIALSMFVTQRGVLYAFPVALLLLYQWRARCFPNYIEPARLRLNLDEPASLPADPVRRPPLPFWVEIFLYATMPLYHPHTFMALSLVLAFLFVLGDWEVRKRSLLLVALSLIPATFCVWITTDYFHASSFIKWQPGWVQSVEKGDMAMPFFQFWLINFGAWVPLVLFFLGIIAVTVWKEARSPDFKISPTVAFLIPALAIFLVGYLVKLAPWEWDNIKIIVWAYFIILPFLWTDLIVHWPVPLRVIVFVALFASGFVTLLGGLAAGKNGFGIADRGELDAIGTAVHKLPAGARYAGWPTWGHPVLLQGRRMVLGYPGHLWTQGFSYSPTFDKLQAMMLGAPNWKQLATELRARYLFWGREEKTNYAASKRPWERESALVASGEWGAIYDLEARSNAPAQSPASVPRQ
jgi:hypothetical protein